MWSAISNFFKANDNNSAVRDSSIASLVMDRGEERRPDMDLQDAYDTRQAKQRASVKWLLSKAFNNKVPENLREPFYRDHENQEHLKPQIVGSLANAEMYCLALGNIYSDPNYHNLNHWSILQTLARKGVFVTEPSDAQLTETTLIQTNPLRMSAHMAVIESIMTLYAKEVVSGDRVLAAMQRFSHGKNPSIPPPESHEQGLLLWVAHACGALKRRIEQDLESGQHNGEGDRLHAPNIPPIKELKDLCDGVALAALVSYYCPDELPWTDLLVSYLPTVSESLHNLSLLHSFCQRCLPCSVFHMLPEDITYMRGSMKQNLIVFLADLFNLLEIHPAKCVRYPGMDRTANESFPARNSQGVVHKRNLPQSVVTPIPDLRSGLDDPSQAPAFQVIRSPSAHMTIRKSQSLQQSTSALSEDSLRRGSDDSFVVHRGKGIPTLSSVIQSEEPLIPARLRTAKEKQNNDTKAEEYGSDGKNTPAGKPSNWEDHRRSSYAGRRSRRNSVTEDSQLTIENFGGSQDNLNFIGRNPDKEVAVHVGRKISAPTGPFESNVAIRSTKQDAIGSIQLGYDNGYEKQDDGREKYKMKRQLSSDAISLRNIIHSKEDIINDVIDGDIANRMSFADVSKQKLLGEQSAIQLVYMQHEKEENTPSKSSFLNKSGNTNGSGEKKTTTFATLPNTTTWQQQSSNSQQQMSNNSNEDGGSGNHLMASQLNDIRMKLEEKRRHIENEKRRMEVVMNKQRQKVGKAAFLQAVTKGKGNLLKTASDSESSSAAGSEPRSPASDAGGQKPQRPLTLQEITEDAMSVEHKWLEQDGGAPFIETRRTPEIENMDLDQYQQSITHMNSSLHDIQADIQRLATQQTQIQVQHQHAFLAQQHTQHMQALAAQLHTIPHYVQPVAPPQTIYNPLQSYGSVPHLSQYHPGHLATSPPIQMEQPQFYLHDQSTPPPQPPQRRTWAQHAPPQPIPRAEHYQSPQMTPPQPELRTWGKPQNTSFILHDTPPPESRYQEKPRFQNGENHSLSTNNLSSPFTLSQQHNQSNTNIFSAVSNQSPCASPQHRNNSVHRQISQLMGAGDSSPVNLQQLGEAPYEKRNSNVIHAPIPAPSVDDMEPQNISFIGNADADALEGISRLNITSGSRTYRIPSPTRPVSSRNAFQQQARMSVPEAAPDNGDSAANEKGFYISFDNEQPKRPKPPLRTKKMSPKKERGNSFVADVTDDAAGLDDEPPQHLLMRDKQERTRQLERELERERVKQEEREMEKRRNKEQQIQTERLRERREASQEREAAAAAAAAAEKIIIGNDLSNPDPDLVDERERKKEKIMLLSLQRRQQQEDAKERKEAEAQARREREKMKEDERARKKEEQAQRRTAILEQYKLKKAIEEAEREGKVLDKSELMGSLKPTPKMRPKGTTGRPRPKTIHIDSGSVEMAEGMMQPSRGKKGSTSNLTVNSSYAPQSSMKRDYYRGSHDSLADRGMNSGLLYQDSPDDSRGMSPSRSANQTLGRRGSYKTSRDPSPAQVRGRPKYPTYQNFKGRKSNSMMNLYGSSSDQDSMVYRYGDTDSGLGRATPPRRAPSPGMGPMRHLPSPSGPGSLPGLMSKRRVFDDGSSDISSTPSSMMDYTGPRLYKQPATKSNRGIMLNAVEYCVFPGVVNREAKRRVLEEIARSESKHFLILFRDAGFQFRALYSYCPDREEISKMYGTGPKQVNDRMFDKFFKYNSGGKCFSQIHTKHLTVTIDAFTIHNSLWQGKKVNLPNKKDMALVI